MPRRRPGELLPFEREVLRAGLDANEAGDRFHGFALATALGGERARALVSHGTLYRALARLQEAGLLTAVWEDPEVAAAEGRPRRKLYEVTPQGAAALAVAERPEPAPARPALGGGTA